MSILVVGSVALDTLETPHGRADNILGGAATNFALSACHFAPVQVVAIVGEDFPRKHIQDFKAHGIDTSGIRVARGLTFRWHGKYDESLSDAKTLRTELNVFSGFDPLLTGEMATCPWIFLANIHPKLQLAVRSQVRSPRVVLADTMNLWIDTQRAPLEELLRQVDALVVNAEEAQMLTDLDRVPAMAGKLLDRGLRWVIIKRGEAGAYLRARDGTVLSVPAYPVEHVVDPTGAGDAFAGGFLGHLSRSGRMTTRKIFDSLVHGTVMASFVIEAFGPTRLLQLGKRELDVRARAFRRMLGH